MLKTILLGLLASAALPVPCNTFSFPVPITRSQRIDTIIIGSHQPPVGAKLTNFRQRLPWFSLPSRVRLVLSAKKSDIESVQNDGRENAQLAINEFISTLQATLDDGSFESFTLKGPSTPRKRRKKKATNNSNSNNDVDANVLLEQQKEKLRGKYKTITGRLVLLQEKKKRKGKKKAAANESDDDDAGTLFLQTTIKYHLATDVAKNWKVTKSNQQSQSTPSSNSEQTEVEEGLKQLFLTAMGDDTDEESGAPLSEWGAQHLTNGELGILTGELVTSDGVYKLQLQPSQNRKASFKLSKQKSTQKERDASSSATASAQGGTDLSHLSHDRSKIVPLSPSAEFFQKLGVSNPDGKPVNGMSSKLRQCQKFVQIVGNLVDNASSNSASSSSSPSRIRVIDMGCGRGYLTFSLHSYLSDKFGSTSATMDDTNAISVETQGIDRRPKLIAEINGIAQDLGGAFHNLNFIEGTIDKTPNSLFADDDLDQNGNAENINSLKMLIALHACDTATDDALWFAIGQDADIIVTAPCCQHELRPQIDRHASDNPDHPLSDILRHAIYRERSTEVVSDAMRAILLEIAGYTTQVFEFIGGEHTAKNVMIAATKVKKRRSEKELNDRRRRLVELAELYGIKRQKLAMLMGESIVSGEADESKPVARNLSGMAPL